MENFKNHYDSLKTWYTTYKRFSKKTGVHVNQTTNEIEMDLDWWDDRCNLQEIPGASHIRNKPLQDLDLLEKYFQMRTLELKMDGQLEMVLMDMCKQKIM